MKYFLTIALFSFASVAASQQFPSDFWHTGKLVLTDGDTLNGKIKYDLPRDLVQLEIDNQILTYGAKKILFFEIFDVTVNTYRQFYSILYSVSQGYKTPILFEVLYEGKLSLLTRESIIHKTSHYNNYYWSGSTYTRKVLTYDYFFLTSKGEMIFYTEKKKDLLVIMKDRAGEIKAYIKTHNLKVDRRGDLARITAYYNSIIES